MKGAIVINQFLSGQSFREPADMMVSSAEKMSLKMSVFSNTDLTVPIGDSESVSKVLDGADFVVFWDKDVMLAKNLEVCGIPVFNCSECIRLCDDKSLTHLVLSDRGIPSIRTVVSPMSFGQPIGEWVRSITDFFQFPIVVKDCFGSFGQQVRLVRNAEELMLESKDGKPRIFQEYIECNGEDLRLEVVGGKVAASVKRRAPEGDFRSNASNGGVMVPYEPSDEEKALAIDAAAAVKADYAGVDIIQSANGPVVCEVNSNAHIKNLCNATGIDVSKDILEHIIDNLR